MDKDKIYIEEIKEFCHKVITFMDNMGYKEFVDNEQLLLAVVKLIENIGEASKRLSEDTRQAYPHVDWKKAMAMRNRLVHNYMDIDPAIVFDVATNEIPAVLKNLE